MQTVRDNAPTWWLMTLGFGCLYYLGLLLSLIIRFQNFPNYLSLFDWFDNVGVILASTPSWRDALAIIREEWLLEVGFMNYDFGTGISEWSLVLLPFNMFGVFALGASLATIHLLLRKRNRVCSSRAGQSARAVGGLGAGFVALASISMYWVVCCSTPTWVVGLAMMGLVGVSTALWLEPLGLWIGVAGFSLMLLAVYLAAGSDRSSHCIKDAC